MSKSTAQTILTNSFIPFLELIQTRFTRSESETNTMKWLGQMQPERNAIINNWNGFIRLPKHAGESQGLIEMTNEFCAKKQCLKCKVGKALFQAD